MTTHSTNNYCCSACCKDGIHMKMNYHADCRDAIKCTCPCHKPTEPSECGFVDTSSGLALTCARLKPCPLHEPKAEVRVVCLRLGCPCHEGKECESAKRVFAQQEEASWEEEVRVGAPWTQDGKKMLKRIRTVEAQAEKRSEVRALEWVLTNIPVVASSSGGPEGYSQGHMDGFNSQGRSLSLAIKDRLTALRNTNE